jgi:hypothetical protein
MWRSRTFHDVLPDAQLLAAQLDQHADHLVLAAVRHEPGRVRVGLRVLVVRLETVIGPQSDRNQVRLVLAQPDEDLAQ